MSVQTLVNLKTAQTAFKNLRTSTKTAFDDPSMGMEDKDMMIEKIFEQAEILVDTAITAVEVAEGGSAGIGNEMITNGIGEEEPTTVPTDIPNVINNEDPDKKLNIARNSNDPMKQAIDETNEKVDDLTKELEAMKAKEAQMKMAQKYADLHPVAMRTAKFNEFMAHKGATAVLEARLDEASVLLSNKTAQKFAQQEDSIFSFDNLEDNRNSTKVDTGSKI